MLAQVTMRSSLKLHALNIVAYAVLKCHASLNLGERILSAATLLEFSGLFLFCTILPAVLNLAWEQAMRRRFMCQQHVMQNCKKMPHCARSPVQADDCLSAQTPLVCMISDPP
jgi:hypothetical protein